MTKDTEATSARTQDAADADVSPAFPSPASPASASAGHPSPPHPSAASADSLDDGTPESDSDPESDASEADVDDEPGTVVAAPPAAAGGERRAPRRRRSDHPVNVPVAAAPARGGRAGWIVATVLLFLLLAGSVLLNWHLWNTTVAWEERADALTEVNYELGEQLARQEQATMQLESELELLTQQLATSNQQVIDLGASKANAEDASEYATQQIEQLTGSLATAGEVTSALQRCVDGQQQLVTYLRAPENYDAVELAAFAQSVDQLCNAAERSSEQLRQALSE